MMVAYSEVVSTRVAKELYTCTAVRRCLTSSYYTTKTVNPFSPTLFLTMAKSESIKALSPY